MDCKSAAAKTAVAATVPTPLHDRAPEFLSNVLQDTAAIFGLQQLPTSGGHPQMDGLVERLN